MPSSPYRTEAGPHRTQVGRLVSSPTGSHAPPPDPNLPSTRRGDRDGAGGGGAFAGEVPAGGGDHDGRRGAAAGVHDLPQQALAVLLLLRRRRRALLLLQADVGTRGSSDLLLPRWRCDGRCGLVSEGWIDSVP
ncbi:hypothetical protein SETIT_2G261900v2 [Setaria italica]|nr:hypothetical protein SETIT_2G261900v2 [Setaria italica]